ncbi:MAG: hypothetical protein Q4E45_03370, partial [Eubacteriales bacterium]|nr:hypothetical protein [Eubacteriales bacterium]
FLRLPGYFGRLRLLKRELFLRVRVGKGRQRQQGEAHHQRQQQGQQFFPSVCVMAINPFRSKLASLGNKRIYIIISHSAAAHKRRFTEKPAVSHKICPRFFVDNHDAAPRSTGKTKTRKLFLRPLDKSVLLCYCTNCLIQQYKGGAAIGMGL